MASWKDALGVVAKIAPTIGSALGGPLIGSGITALEGALGVKTDSNDIAKRQDAIAAAVSAATPDQMLAIKQADNDFAAKMAELGFANQQAIEQLAVQDRDSARKRETAVKDWTPRILAYVVIAASIGIAYGVLFHEMSADNATIGMIAGFMFREAAEVMGYYFGSSSNQSTSPSVQNVNTKG
jgi:hypothetical protein